MNLKPNQQPNLPPFVRMEGDLSKGLILLCDHASSYVPKSYKGLGLADNAFKRHIAYDIGAQDLTQDLARDLGVPAIMSQFSRLLIDPNRGEDDPTLIMKLSDGQAVPENIKLDEEERLKRLNSFYLPYHQAISAQIDACLAHAKPPILLSIHSFTDNWRGDDRPWEAGILWDNDPRFALPFLHALRQVTGCHIGENEPYTGRLKGDCMYRHGTMRGLAHCLLEIRQDLIRDTQGIAEWCEYIKKALPLSLQAPELHEIKHFGSAAK